MVQVEAIVLVEALGSLAATDFGPAHSADGKAWVAALPALISDLASQWGLVSTGGDFRHGDNSVVLPVFQRDRPLALKLTWPPDRAQGEADALAIWQGRGAVGLVAADPPRGALLLAHLDAPGR